MQKNLKFIVSIIIFFIITIFISWLTMQINNISNNPSSTIKSVSPQEFKLEYDNYITDNSIIIDVRTASEFNSGHLNGSINIDFENQADFNKQMDSLNKNSKYLIYCRSGNRSGQALNAMQSKGFINIVNLKDGLIGWNDAGFKTQ